MCKILLKLDPNYNYNLIFYHTSRYTLSSTHTELLEAPNSTHLFLHLHFWIPRGQRPCCHRLVFLSSPPSNAWLQTTLRPCRFNELITCIVLRTHKVALRTSSYLILTTTLWVGSAGIIICSRKLRLQESNSLTWDLKAGEWHNQDSTTLSLITLLNLIVLVTCIYDIVNTYDILICVCVCVYIYIYFFFFFHSVGLFLWRILTHTGLAIFPSPPE